MRFMHFPSAVRRHLLALPLLLASGVAGAQGSAPGAAGNFPTRPVRIIVNTAPGGLTDISARLVGQKMGERLGQPVIVENRAGGDGLLGIRAVKAAPADGYTLLATAGTFVIQPAVKLDAGYDPTRDFTGIGPMVRSSLLVVSAPEQPFKTLPELLAKAKAAPGQISYASAGVGTTTHVGAALLFQQSGAQLLHVPYKGNGAAMPDVMSGRVGLILEAYGSGASKVKEGRLRALAVTASRRLPGLPDVPTVAEQGVPGFSYYLWLGLMAPAGTPPDAVQKLSDALRSALASKDLEERLRADGAEAMVMSPAEFNEFVRRDAAAMARLVSELGLPKQ